MTEPKKLKVKLYSKIHDRTKERIWIVTPYVHLPRNEWPAFQDDLRKIKGRYSKFVNGIVFKHDPTDKLINYEVVKVDFPTKKALDEPAAKVPAPEPAPVIPDPVIEKQAKKEYTPKEGWETHL